MKPYSNIEELAIKKHYKSLGVLGVQKHIDRSSDSIRHKAKSLGITREKGFRCSKLDLSEFYSNITPNGAYFLGLIWGDGNLMFSKRHNQISVTLQKEDFDNLRPLFNKFNIHKVKKQKKSWKQCFKAYVGHYEFAKFLFDNDYTKKSICSPKKILSQIKEECHHYFFRGWFDADGSCNELKKGKYTISVSGSFYQDWWELISMCMKLKVTFTIFKQVSRNEKENKSSKFSISGFNNIIRFRNFLYQGENIGLDRKRKNFYSIREPLRFNSLNP